MTLPRLRARVPHLPCQTINVFSVSSCPQRRSGCMCPRAGTECEVNSDMGQEGRALAGPEHPCWGVIQPGADEGWTTLGVSDEAQRGRDTGSASLSRPHLPSGGRSSLGEGLGSTSQRKEAASLVCSANVSGSHVKRGKRAFSLGRTRRRQQSMWPTPDPGSVRP